MKLLIRYPDKALAYNTYFFKKVAKTFIIASLISTFGAKVAKLSASVSNLDTPAAIYLGVCGTPSAYGGVRHVLDIRGKYLLPVSGLYVAEMEH